MKYLLHLSVTFILYSCGNTPAVQQQTAAYDPSFSIAGKDSVVFDADIFYQYNHRQPKPGDMDTASVNELSFYKGSKDEMRYQAQFFISNDPNHTSASFLIDSIPMKNGIYSLLFANWTYHVQDDKKFEDSQAWLVNYSSDNKYIDSRLIYRNEKAGNRQMGIYSKLYLPKKKLVIFDGNNIFGENFEIPVAIRENGTFEEFPDIPFATGNIAAGNCNGNGIFGKFPLKQKWTVVSFGQDDLVATCETNQIYYDYIENVSTLFAHFQERYIPIAFKGVYTRKDIDILSVTSENDEETVNLIKQNLPDEDYFSQGEFSNIQLYSFTNPGNKNKFWIAYYTIRQTDFEDQALSSLIGVSPNRQVVLLAKHCVYKEETYVMRLQNDFLLYVSESSCGDGAQETIHLYKMDTKFEKLFESTIVCD